MFVQTRPRSPPLSSLAKVLSWLQEPTAKARGDAVVQLLLERPAMIQRLAEVSHEADRLLGEAIECGLTIIIPDDVPAVLRGWRREPRIVSKVDRAIEEIQKEAFVEWDLRH